MIPKIGLVMLMGSFLMSGCVPVAIGAGAVVLVDHIIEDEKGGDGLF